MNRAMVCLLASAAVLLNGCAGDAGRTPSADGPGPGALFHEDAIGSQVQREFGEATELLRQGEYQRGLEILERLQRQRDARASAALHVNRGIAYDKLGKPEQAEEALKAALAVDPGHPVANNEYGLLLRRGGRFPEARVAYEKALASHPDFLPARRNLGILCDLYLRDLECAMEHYQVYAAAVPEDRAVAAWIADLRQKMGNAHE